MDEKNVNQPEEQKEEKGFLGNLMDKVGDALGTAGDFIEEKYDELKEKTMVGDALEKVEDVLETVGDKVRDVVENVKDRFDGDDKADDKADAAHDEDAPKA